MTGSRYESAPNSRVSRYFCSGAALAQRLEKHILQRDSTIFCGVSVEGSKNRLPNKFSDSKVQYKEQPLIPKSGLAQAHT